MNLVAVYNRQPAIRSSGLLRGALVTAQRSGDGKPDRFLFHSKPIFFPDSSLDHLGIKIVDVNGTIIKFNRSRTPCPQELVEWLSLNLRRQISEGKINLLIGFEGAIRKTKELANRPPQEHFST